MKLNSEYRTFAAFRPHFDALARVAYFKIVLRPASYLKLLFHDGYRIVIWGFVLLYNLQHLIRVVQTRHSADQMVDTLFILLTTLNSLSKQLAFNLRSARVERIIRIIDGPLFEPRNSYDVSVLKSNQKAMSGLLMLNHASIFVCGLLWTLFPLVNRALGDNVEFTAYIPFDTSVSPRFELVVFYMGILITFQAYGHVTMDCLIVSFYAQAKTQLQILRNKLEHLVDDEDDRITYTKRRQGFKDLEQESFKKLVQKRLANCVDHYNQIVWFTKEVQSIFGEVMIIQFIVMAWVICMTVYKIVGLSLLSLEFVSMAVYLCCMLAQLFIYCFYGTQLTSESNFVNQSLYCGDWQSLSPRFRRSLLVMMQCCSRSISLRVAYVVPISLDTYIAVLKFSYTLFTFLNQK